MFENTDGTTNWGNIIRLLGAATGVGGSLMSAFKKEPQPYGINEAGQAIANSNTYMNAAADPNSPYFKNLSATEEQRGRNDLITSIDRIMREIASRKAGGRGTINPERRDETVWGILAKGFQEAGWKAREAARDRLLQMAGGQRQNAAAYSSLAQPSAIMQLFNRQNQNSGVGIASQGIMRLGEMAKPQSGTVNFGKSSVPDWFKDQSFGLQY